MFEFVFVVVVIVTAYIIGSFWHIASVSLSMVLDGEAWLLRDLLFNLVAGDREWARYRLYEIFS